MHASGGAQMEGGRWALLSGDFGLVHSIIRSKKKDYAPIMFI